MHRALGFIPSTIETRHGIACLLCQVYEVPTGAPELQGYPWLCIQFIASLVLYVAAPGAKKLPSWGVQLCALTKELPQLDFLTIYFPSWKTSPEYTSEVYCGSVQLIVYNTALIAHGLGEGLEYIS